MLRTQELSADSTAFNCPSASPDVRNLTKKLVTARQNFDTAKFNAKNEGQKYKYAKLDAVYEAVMDGLRANGINIYHYKVLAEGRIYLCTRLVDQDTNQYIEDIDVVEPDKPGAQARQACITYLKKSAVLSLCAIATGEDDDQEDAQKHLDNNGITTKQYAELTRFIKSFANAPIVFNAIIKRLNIEALENMRKDQITLAYQVANEIGTRNEEKNEL